MSVKVITVSREFGSGGRTVGKEVAERLGWAYYDKELVKKIAAESGLAESYILESGEYACSTNSFLFSWVMNAAGGYNGTLPMSDQLYIIQKQHHQGPGGQGALCHRGPLLGLRPAGPGRLPAHLYPRGQGDARRQDSQAVRRAHRHAGKAPEGEGRQAPGPITGTTPGASGARAENYHICLDSGKLGIERCVDIIVDAARERVGD